MQVFNGMGAFSNDWSMMMPAFVPLLPMVIFYLFMQKQIVEGVVSGAEENDLTI